MTLRQFLASTEAFPPDAVRLAMAGGIAALLPGRLRDRRSYAAFYRKVLERLRVVAAGRLAPATGPPPSWNGHDPSWHDDAGEVAVMYRRLAVRVIERAVRDLTAPVCAATDRETARAFLSGSPMLRHWCSVADIDPRRVVARVTAMRQPGTDESASGRPPIDRL